MPGPTCSYMLKQEYPWLDGSEDANLVAAHTRDLFEYLAGLHAAGAPRHAVPEPARHDRLPAALPPARRRTSAPSPPTSCASPGRQVEVVERCSAVDGTWGMKKEYFELSMKLAEPLFRDIERRPTPDRVATDCPLAALQIRQGTGRAARHPIQILAEAYGLDPEDAA